MGARKLNDYINVIGDNLKYYRQLKHLSQDDMIRELDLLGIYLIENYKRTVKDYELWGFIKVLNINFDDLIKGIENKL